MIRRLLVPGGGGAGGRRGVLLRSLALAQCPRNWSSSRGLADSLTLRDDIGRRIQAELLLPVADIRLIQPARLPRTSSGKLQRAKVRQQYLDDSFRDVARLHRVTASDRQLTSQSYYRPSRRSQDTLRLTRASPGSSPLRCPVGRARAITKHRRRSQVPRFRNLAAFQAECGCVSSPCGMAVVIRGLGHRREKLPKADSLRSDQEIRSRAEGQRASILRPS